MTRDASLRRPNTYKKMKAAHTITATEEKWRNEEIQRNDPKRKKMSDRKQMCEMRDERQLSR